MRTAAIIYPHQLFRSIMPLRGIDLFFLVEDPLFFRQFKYHKHKLMLHRASMKYYADFLQRERQKEVVYLDCVDLKHSKDVIPHLRKAGVTEVKIYDPTDDWLERALTRELKAAEIKFTITPSQLFLSEREKAAKFLGEKIFFTSFYIKQRKEHEVLLTADGEAAGGKWTYDTENRKKLPKDLTPPEPMQFAPNEYTKEAAVYIDQHFADNYGNSAEFNYGISHEDADLVWKFFKEQKFAKFGDYQDAIHSEHTQNYHALISPYLNNGLLDVTTVIKEAENLADIPINAREGFIRQILGWREFMYAVYRRHGVEIRNSNFFGHQEPIGEQFYTGETGFAPIDDSIKRAQSSAYLHHIERLMLLGNFMLLTRRDPNAVYRWFMEMFVDAYDWVMVANTYSMALFADGGMITTKPYISSANYIHKMSNYRKADWSEEFTALYWSFLADEEEKLKENGRIGFAYNIMKKFPDEKLKNFQQMAAKTIKQLN